jgi:hypothetical protein
MWLVRAAGRGVWGAEERACIFATKAAARSTAAALQAAADGEIIILPFYTASNGTLPEAANYKVV